MASSVPAKGLQLRSHVKSSGELELSLVEVDVPTPGPDDVIVRVEATPINPSDLGLLLGAADMGSAKATGSADRPVVTAKVPAAGMRAMAPRIDQSMPVGNEGAGTVVAAGSSPAAQALLGKTVAGLGGEMYSQYRMLNVAQCMELPAGATARDGASCFVNPLTALAMTEVMRMEGHKALLHTAAASNLGQMLNKICIADGIQLVNIVRKQEQEDLLRSIGATHVVNSSLDSFTDDLTAALIETGATIAFDAIGGGPLAGQILAAMEVAANASQEGGYSRYGSTTHKQVYIYGGLNRGETTLSRNYGTSWSVGGWLLTNFLIAIGKEPAQALRQRVVDELQTTFASHYTSELSLAAVLDPANVVEYAKHATGEKALITPQA